MITSAFLLLVNIGLNLSDLSSPCKMDQIARSELSESNYFAETQHVREFLDQYSLLSQEQKKALVLDWFKQVASRESALAKNSLKKKKILRPSNNEGLDADLAKIDLLLIYDHKPSFFHTEQWIKELYCADLNVKGLVISKISRGLPEMYAPFHSGPIGEFPFTSYDWVMVSENKAIREWIRSDLDSKKFVPMTFQTMMSRINDLIKN